MLNLVGWNLLFIFSGFNSGQSNRPERTSSDKSHVFQRCVPNNKSCISCRQAERAGSPRFKRWGLAGHRREQPLACNCERSSGTYYCGSPPLVSALSPGYSMLVSVLLLHKKKKKVPQAHHLSHACIEMFRMFSFLIFSTTWGIN